MNLYHVVALTSHCLLLSRKHCNFSTSKIYFDSFILNFFSPISPQDYKIGFLDTTTVTIEKVNSKQIIRCLRPCTSDHIGSSVYLKTAEAANSNLSFVTYFINDLVDMSEMLRFMLFLFHDFLFCKCSIKIHNVSRQYTIQNNVNTLHFII